MPFIHVKSLPFEPSIQISEVVEGLTRDFAQGTGIDLEHVTATWEFFQPTHYAVAGKVASHQPEDAHPVLVDLLVPDFNSSEQVEKMLLLIASSICKRTNLSAENVFINCRLATAGLVFDAGKVVRW